MEKIIKSETSNTETVTISHAEYESLLNQNEWLMQQLRLLRQRKFGSSSEKASDAVVEQLSLLFNEAEAFTQHEVKETKVPAHIRRQHSGSVHDILPDDIAVETIEHRLPEEQLFCPQCGEIMVEIGTEVHESLKLIPAKAVLQKDVYYTYACKNCDKNNISTPIIKTPKGKVIIPGSFASPEAVAHIMTQKFVMGSPIYRQEQELNRMGIQLSRQTMSNWILRCANDWLKPIYDELHQQLLQRKVLHADETTLQVLKEPGKKAQSKSYMWLYRTSGDTDNPIVLYEYQQTRGQEHPNAFLKGFTGYLHTDGYSAYHSLPEHITVVGCWAHLRRKFDEAVNSLPKGKRTAGSTAVTGQAYCTRLFKLEQQFAKLTPEERFKQRLEREKPVMEAMFAWAETRHAAPKSALGKALEYLKNQKPYLLNYLKDKRLELSNNRAERSIKPFVIDRKNFLFANTPNGAQGSAIIFSLIETAKEHNLDPYRYLTYVLKIAPDLDQSAPKWVSPLLPENAPDDCRIPKKT